MLLESMRISNNEWMLEVYQVAHLVPGSAATISLSRFEFTAIDNGVDVSDGSENLLSKDLAALFV